MSSLSRQSVAAGAVGRVTSDDGNQLND